MRTVALIAGGLVTAALAARVAEHAPAFAQGAAAPAAPAAAAPSTRLGAAVQDGLSERARQLDARERQLSLREGVLKGVEARLAAQAEALRTARAALQQQAAARRGQDAAQAQALARLYAAMRPKDAGRLMDGLSPELRVSIAAQMRERALAPVLAAMAPANAARLTADLANRPPAAPTPSAAVS